MNLPLRITGYDKVTERLSIEHAVPGDLVSEARRLAHAGAGDDGLGVYFLDAAAAITLGLKMERTFNADLYDWFLEPG